MSPSSTSSSDRQGLGSFCLQVTLFLAPLLVFGGVFEWAFWRSGESWSMEHIAQAHDERETVLVRKQYFGQTSFKTHRIRMVKPDIVSLGTSRSLQIRDLFFDPSKATFYNSSTIGTFAEIQAYADALAKGDLPTPKVAILCIEPWWIKSGLPPSVVTWDKDASYSDSVFIPVAHVTAIKQCLKAGVLPLTGQFKAAFSPAPHSGSPAVGMAALSKDVGFRKDGSYQYDPAIVMSFLAAPKYVDREVPPVIENLRNATDKFTPSASIDEERVQSMLRSFEQLRGRGVEVVVVLPPFAKECHDVLEQGRPEHGWWNDYKSKLPATLNAAGFTCVGPAKPQDYGLEDTTMWDGYHASEVLMARVIDDLVMKTPSDSRIRTLISPKLAELAQFSAHPLSLEPEKYHP